MTARLIIGLVILLAVFAAASYMVYLAAGVKYMLAIWAGGVAIALIEDIKYRKQENDSN